MSEASVEKISSLASMKIIGKHVFLYNIPLCLKRTCSNIMSILLESMHTPLVFRLYCIFKRFTDSLFLKTSKRTCVSAYAWIRAWCEWSFIYLHLYVNDHLYVYICMWMIFYICMWIIIYMFIFICELYFYIYVYICMWMIFYICMWIIIYMLIFSCEWSFL